MTVWRGSSDILWHLSRLWHSLVHCVHRTIAILFAAGRMSSRGGQLQAGQSTRVTTKILRRMFWGWALHYVLLLWSSCSWNIYTYIWFFPPQTPNSDQYWWNMINKCLLGKIICDQLSTKPSCSWNEQNVLYKAKNFKLKNCNYSKS